MNIEKARKIDYWLGVPLCFLLSCVNYIQKAVWPKKNGIKPAGKILFIKLSELGAIILAYPLIDRIKKEHVAADLFFVTFDKNKDIFKLLGGVIPDENILRIREERTAFVLDTLKAINRLRREKIDIIFDLEFFSRFSAIFSYLAGAEKRIGFYHYSFEGLYRGDLVTHKIQYNPLNHIARNYLSLSQVAKQIEKKSPQMEEGVNDGELKFPIYTPDSKTKERISEKLRDIGVDTGKVKLFLLNPGDGVLPLREWPIDNFIALARLILENKDNYILIIGTEGAARKAKLILDALNTRRCESLVNRTELRELLGLFSIADSLISNDCGLAHLAMLSPVKKFIIFGPESPKIFGPLGDKTRILYSDWPCSPCLSVLNHRDSRCTDNKCLKVIKPQDILNLILESQREL
ncbi:MAG: glycosyltransferase family 9 protein [Candidatus Omnitrophota bacterium]